MNLNFNMTSWRRDVSDDVMTSAMTSSLGLSVTRFDDVSDDVMTSAMTSWRQRWRQRWRHDVSDDIITWSVRHPFFQKCSKSSNKCTKIKKNSKIVIFKWFFHSDQNVFGGQWNHYLLVLDMIYKGHILSGIENENWASNEPAKITKTPPKILKDFLKIVKFY